MEIFGSNTPAAVQYLLAFVTILILLAGLAAVLRRMTGGKSRAGFSGISARHRQQRLGVIDAVDIDSHRQLLLLRRDNIEHLVMIGGPNDLLVESGIGRLPYRAPGPLPLQSHHVPQGMEGAAPDLAAGSQVAGGGVTQAPLSAPSPEVVARMGSAKEREGVHIPISSEEVMQPNLADQTAARAPGARPLATPVARSTMSSSVPSATPLSSASKDLSGKGISSKSASAQGEVGAGLTTGPLSSPAGGAAGSMAGTSPEQSSGPMPVSTRESDITQRPLSGVTRQLEEALRRPFGAVRPSSVTGIKLDDTQPEDVRGVKGAAELQTQEEPVPAQGSAAKTPATHFIAPLPAEPAIPPRPVTSGYGRSGPPPSTPPVATIGKPFAATTPGTHHVTPVVRETVQNVAKKVTEEAVSGKVKPEAPPASPEKAQASTPAPEAAKAPSFDLSSLENIEAEFARLLGRTPPSKGE